MADNIKPFLAGDVQVTSRHVTAAAPIDDRIVVTKKSDLYASGTWRATEGDSKTGWTCYTGMVVTVLEENALYVLTYDKNTPSDLVGDPEKEENWKKLGADLQITGDVVAVKGFEEPDPDDASKTIIVYYPVNADGDKDGD